MKPRLALIAVGALLCTPALAIDTPVAVSPGSPTGAVTAHPCPTFSWGRVDGAKSYEIIVYRVLEQGDEGEAVFRERVPGAASSWTPPLGLCLERGGQYAWSARALNRKEASEWSPPNLLQVADGFSQEEFEEALAVVQSYLEVQKEGGPTSGSRADAEAQITPQTKREAPEAPQAVAPTELSVDGGVEAVSFTGDGSTLTSLDPANLSPGTAAIDVTGTAANVTGTVAVAHGGTGATDAAGARGNLGATAQADFSSHSGDPSAHHVQTVDTVLTEGQVETFVTNGPLDGTNFTNVTAVAGDSATSFFSTGQIEEPRIDDAIARDSELGAVESALPGRLCAALSFRWVDLEDGTILDCKTGKMWLKDATCLGADTWNQRTVIIAAFKSGADFGCAEYTPGTYSDWRIPEADEFCTAWVGGTLSPCPASARWDSLMDSTVAGSPVVANGSGEAIWTADDAFVRVQSERYWTNTETDPDISWWVDLADGTVGIGFKANNYRVWAVRGGQ